MILQQWLARLFNSHWHDCSTVTGRIIQQWLVWLSNSHWHDFSTGTGTIDQQWLARFFNSHWHNSSTVTSTIVEQPLAGLFSSQGQSFFFLCWRSLLKNLAMYQEYGTWFKKCICFIYNVSWKKPFQCWRLKLKTLWKLA